jgi:hypothetical protein
MLGSIEPGLLDDFIRTLPEGLGQAAAKKSRRDCSRYYRGSPAKIATYADICNSLLLSSSTTSCWRRPEAVATGRRGFPRLVLYDSIERSDVIRASCEKTARSGHRGVVVL